MSKIYLITNDINDKVYVDKTEFTIEKRFREHCTDCQQRQKEKRPLYAAMRKYGIEHFSIKELEDCSTEEAASREQFWIKFYNSYEEGYNATQGGDGKVLINRDIIMELWNQGLTVRGIAQKINHDCGYISKILKSLGIEDTDIELRGTQAVSKAIEMLDVNSGEVIKTFSSMREGANFLVQKHSLNIENVRGYASQIGQVCSGKRKTCWGYRWRYASLEEKST